MCVCVCVSVCVHVWHKLASLYCSGGAGLKDEEEHQWARRCACDAAGAVELRDAIGVFALMCVCMCMCVYASVTV